MVLLGHNRIEPWRKGDAVGVQPTLLVLGEPVVGAIDGCSDRVLAGSKVGEGILRGDLKDLIVLFLFREYRVIVGGKTGDIERAAWRRSVGNGSRGRTDAACAEPREERGTGVGGVSSSHCGDGRCQLIEWVIRGVMDRVDKS